MPKAEQLAARPHHQQLTGKIQADYLLPMTSPLRPLIVRLRNWVGDVTLSLPMLQRLADEGHDLQLVGKAWAADLLAAHGWPVHTLPAGLLDRVALLRRLRQTARAVDPGFDERLNALCLPDSFSSALEMRLAGLRSLGHAWEGRALLLQQAVPRQRGVHELQVYWQLGNVLQRQTAAQPVALGLKVAARHAAQAATLRQSQGIEADCIVICPFAGGTWNQQEKTWPEFPALANGWLQSLGRTVVVCPGPGEEALAQEQYPRCKILPGVRLGTYAALLKDAALMISNDTGPGHMAAAVGTALVSVLGPSDARLWQAVGLRVSVVQGSAGWPDTDAVKHAVLASLAVENL